MELKFKPICPDTGSVGTSFKLDLHNSRESGAGVWGLAWWRYLIVCESEPVLCQNTGLHDVFGNEIYEGDVLRDTDNEFDFYVVKYDQGSFFAFGEGAPHELLNDLLVDDYVIKGNRWQPEFRDIF